MGGAKRIVCSSMHFAPRVRSDVSEEREVGVRGSGRGHRLLVKTYRGTVRNDLTGSTIGRIVRSSRLHREETSRVRGSVRVRLSDGTVQIVKSRATWH